MIRITFEGTTQDVMKEMEDLVNALSTTRKPVVETAQPGTGEVGAVNEAKEPSLLAMAAESARSLVNTTQEPTKREYKLEELQAAMQPFINTKLKELQELLAKFQVVSLVDLPKKQYSAFAEELRALGATI